MTEQERREIIRPLVDAFPVGAIDRAIDNMIRVLRTRKYPRSVVVEAINRAVTAGRDKFWPSIGTVLERCDDVVKQRKARQRPDYGPKRDATPEGIERDLGIIRGGRRLTSTLREPDDYVLDLNAPKKIRPVIEHELPDVPDKEIPF